MKRGKKAPAQNEYEIELQKCINICKSIGRSIKYDEFSQYGLRSSRWYVKYCTNPLVNNYNEFVELKLGLKPNYMMSKESVVKYILQLQKTLNRPIIKKDLEGNKNISIGLINRIWGNFNNMKKDLGLEIIQENTNEKKKSIYEIKRDIVRLCAYILNTKNRYTMTVSDWKLLDNIASYQTCVLKLYQDNTTIRDFIDSIGFNLQESGTGLNYVYDDSELIKSQYEKYFSDYLRNKGMIFNKDYFRNIKYSNFSNTRSNYDCDYKIIYNNKTYYIEIAGMLRDYKEWFYNNKPLNSKIREKYRLKLNEKIELVKKLDLNYYIVFPDDLNVDFLDKLFT